MSPIVAVLGALALATVVVSAASAEETVAGAPKVLEGPMGERITLVFLEPKADGRVLIAFDGVDGEWDGKVVLHKRVVNRDKEDYWVDGQKYVSLVLRGGRWALYPKGAPKEVSVSYSRAGSAKVDGAKIIVRWRSQLEGASK